MRDSHLSSEQQVSEINTEVLQQAKGRAFQQPTAHPMGLSLNP